MHYFTPAKTLPEGTIYLTDLTHVADFADWLETQQELIGKVGLPNYLQTAAQED